VLYFRIAPSSHRANLSTGGPFPVEVGGRSTDGERAVGVVRIVAVIQMQNTPVAAGALVQCR